MNIRHVVDLSKDAVRGYIPHSRMCLDFGCEKCNEKYRKDIETAMNATWSPAPEWMARLEFAFYGRVPPSNNGEPVRLNKYWFKVVDGRWYSYPAV